MGDLVFLFVRITFHIDCFLVVVSLFSIVFCSGVCNAANADRLAAERATRRV
jgi:hypothetical protein